MTDNIRLYDVTISFTDSDFTSGQVTLPASTGSELTATKTMLHVMASSGLEGSVLYNWCAAMAGAGGDCSTTVAQDISICPKNWMLPTSGGTSIDKTFEKLADAYGVANGLNGFQDSSHVSYVLGIRATGYFTGSEENQQTTYAHYWTSTAKTTSNADHYIVRSSNNVIYSRPKKETYAVRCVAR